MLFKTRPRTEVKSSEITPEIAYLNRRHFFKKGGQYALAGAALTMGVSRDVAAQKQGQPYSDIPQLSAPQWLKAKVRSYRQGEYRTDETLTPYSDVSTYNNFYEFGTDKSAPSRYAKDFMTSPWSVTVEGEAAKTGHFTLEDILKPQDIEERVYRLRCVEAWSMVIPWVGFSLADMLKRFEPTSRAKYVVFQTLFDPKQMPGQRSRFTAIEYPYVEGLRIDEAMNPLSFMAIGLYGKTLPPQNGAPLRLVVPWKYGFKSIKSIVKIQFTETKPKTTWEKSAPREYGFYANVNPHVDHPRWSQKRERRLPGTLWQPNRMDTQMYNGYAEEVAHLYKGMDLSKYY